MFVVIVRVMFIGRVRCSCPLLCVLVIGFSAVALLLFIFCVRSSCCCSCCLILFLFL